jgi:hypothetical protein
MSAGLTHPVIALLDHPLFAFGGKRAATSYFKLSDAIDLNPFFLDNAGNKQFNGIIL